MPIRLDSLDQELVVDSGFIVFNQRNYPELRGMLTHLKIEIFPTHMSFSVSDKKNNLEFSKSA